VGIRKTKVFKGVKFTESVITTGFNIFVSDRQIREFLSQRDIKLPGEAYLFDTDAEFFSFYHRPDVWSAELSTSVHASEDNIGLWFYNEETQVKVRSDNRELIDRVFNHFQAHSDSCRMSLADKETALRKRLRIFIGHGHDSAWRDVKDHLHEKHGYMIEAYETAPRAGLTITDVLKDAKRDSGFAILVMTAENKDADGHFRARENVIHECGLFQGKLGMKRAIVLREDGCEEFSNLAGVQYIPFAKGRVQETFGEILATIKREFLDSDT